MRTRRRCPGPGGGGVGGADRPSGPWSATPSFRAHHRPGRARSACRSAARARSRACSLWRHVSDASAMPARRHEAAVDGRRSAQRMFLAWRRGCRSSSGRPRLPSPWCRSTYASEDQERHPVLVQGGAPRSSRRSGSAPRSRRRTGARSSPRPSSARPTRRRTPSPRPVLAARRSTPRAPAGAMPEPSSMQWPTGKPWTITVQAARPRRGSRPGSGSRGGVPSRTPWGRVRPWGSCARRRSIQGGPGSATIWVSIGPSDGSSTSPARRVVAPAAALQRGHVGLFGPLAGQVGHQPLELIHTRRPAP